MLTDQLIKLVRLGYRVEIRDPLSKLDEPLWWGSSYGPAFPRFNSSKHQIHLDEQTVDYWLKSRKGWSRVVLANNQENE